VLISIPVSLFGAHFAKKYQTAETGS